MSYPDPPGQRIAYDLDGSDVITFATGGQGVVEIDGAALNSDDPATFTPYWADDFGGDPTAWIAVIFPRRMRLEGVFVAAYATWYTEDIFTNVYGSAARLKPRLEGSHDTTNGLDGTWLELKTLNSVPRPDGWSADYFNDVLGNSSSRWAEFLSAVPEWRRRDQSVDDGGWTKLTGADYSSLKAVRLRFPDVPSGVRVVHSGGFNPGGGGIKGVTLHLYGAPAATAAQGELRFIDATDSADHDFAIGDVHPGQQVVARFRVANLSSTLTATEVGITPVAAVPPGLPAAHSGIQFSENGTLYSSSITLDSIPPNSNSSVLYVRMTVPAAGLVGPWSPRVQAEVGAWT